MSSINQIRYGEEPTEYDSHKDSFLTWLDAPVSIWDETEDFDEGDGYDDNNGFYRKAISKVASNPKKFFDRHKKQFRGQEWYPKNFFQKMYLKNILSTTKKFVKDLEKLNLEEVSRKQTIKNHIIKLKRSLEKAEIMYNKDQVECVILISEVLVIGRKILKIFKKLDDQKRLE